MIVLAVTGGFGTGKTTVAGMFRALGAAVVDVDQIVRELEQPGKSAWKKIVQLFGKKILKSDQTLDRPAIAALVFGNKELLQKLDAAVHPLVMKETLRQAGSLKKKNPNGLVVVDIPLLFEVNAQQQFDKVLVVKASDELVLERIMQNRKLSAVEINLRIQAQIPLEKKVLQADFVVDNNNGLDETGRQAKAIFSSLLA